MRKREVGHEIHAISKLLGRRIEAEKREQGISDVTTMQIWIIGYLYDHRDREVYQKDIERDFTITRSTVTGILKLMEKKGFIRRTTVPEDARLKKLILLEKGEVLLKGVRSHIEQTEKMLVQGLSEEEVETLFRLLEQIRNNLES